MTPAPDPYTCEACGRTACGNHFCIPDESDTPRLCDMCLTLYAEAIDNEDEERDEMTLPRLTPEETARLKVLSDAVDAARCDYLDARNAMKRAKAALDLAKCDRYEVWAHIRDAKASTQ